MLKSAQFLLLGFVCVVHAVFAADDVVINEIYYNPLDDADSEFVEIYNPTLRTIDLSEYTFTDGIFYSFPANAKLRAGGYAVIVRFTNSEAWSGKTYDIYGPFIDELNDKGELIRLRFSDGRVVDEVEYDDYLPWPTGADGYGSSLERISPDLPSNDYHSWRSSLKVSRSYRQSGGSPGARNSVVNVSPKPMISEWEITPEFPISNDDVHLQVTLDGADLIQTVKLRYETVKGTTVSSVKTTVMSHEETDGDLVVYGAMLAAQSSQTLVRWVAEITLKNNDQVTVPHSAEVRPFNSYFVYDRDIPSLLPVLWFYLRPKTYLTPSAKIVSGVVIKEDSEEFARVYDGARVEASRNGHKVRFLKHEEYHGNRTLNMLPESPPVGTTSGPQTPHVEQLSYEIFEDFGVMVPHGYWFRVITGTRHTQQVLIQQNNEKFLEINGRDSTGNIYKIAYNEPGGYKKMTNTLEDDSDYRKLLNNIGTGSEAQRKAAVYRYLDVEKVMGYEVAGVLMSNWDGFFNNMFLYHDPMMDQWECIPWDLDKTFGYASASAKMFAEMPVDFPLDGKAAQSSRAPGPISRPFHRIGELHEDYKLRLRQGLNGLFSQERIGAMIDDVEEFLLEDLELQQDYTNRSVSTRKNQIIESYNTMRTFLRLRHQYLDGVLPVLVNDWQLY